jgi:hypothetical protein
MCALGYRRTRRVTGETRHCLIFWSVVQLVTAGSWYLTTSSCQKRVDYILAYDAYFASWTTKTRVLTTKRSWVALSRSWMHAQCSWLGLA